MRYTGVGGTDAHAVRLMDSYRRWTGKSLLDETDDPDRPFEELFHAPIVVLSHGTEADPVLNFGSRKALELWEMDWDTFTRTPSRLTAEPMEREERARFMKAVGERGYVDDYTGVRISSTGKRFYIMQATVWNVTDENGVIHGQAATFRTHREV